jgi:hypothetical protein
MGDAPPPSSSVPEYQNQNTQHGSNTVESQLNAPQGQPQLDQQAALPPHLQQQQQQYGSQQQAFSSQFDMAQATGSTRPGAFHMGGMANALPQPGYRPGGYPSQQRFGVANSSPSMLPQMPQMSQYPNQGGMAMAGQYYHMQHHPQVQQYYGGQMSQSQQQTNIPQRQGIAFYSNQLMMNQQPGQMPSLYYYAQAGQYPGHNPAIPASIVSGSFIPANPPQGGQRHPSQPSIPDSTSAPAISQPANTGGGK